LEKTAPTYDTLIERFVAWAKNEDNIRAVVVIGSRARTEDHPADEWSDLDLLILAHDPGPLIETTGWLNAVGTPWLTFVEPTPGDGGFERRVLFAGGLDVDFAPIPADEIRRMKGRPLPPVMDDILRRGVRIILDKDGFAGMLPKPEELPAPAETRPAESDFLNRVNDFWYHAVWTAKRMRRGELWRAHSCCDMYLKNLLRQMLEWHARATNPGTVDTWMRGRFLEEWASPRAAKALSFAFAHHNPEDVWRALRVTMDLFRGLAIETADALGYPYPSSGEEKARTLVEDMFTKRTLHD
jgi:aminoglycoside 6-adenylyltransferase